MSFKIGVFIKIKEFFGDELVFMAVKIFTLGGNSLFWFLFSFVQPTWLLPLKLWPFRGEMRCYLKTRGVKHTRPKFHLDRKKHEDYHSDGERTGSTWGQLWCVAKYTDSPKILKGESK